MTRAVFFVAMGVLACTWHLHADPPGHGPLVRFPDPPRLMLPTEVRANVGYHVGGGNPFPHPPQPQAMDEGI